MFDHAVSWKRSKMRFEHFQRTDLNTRQPNMQLHPCQGHTNLRACRHINVYHSWRYVVQPLSFQRRRNGCQVSCAFFHLVCEVCTWCSCILMRGLDFNTIFTLPVYAMGPFTSRVPFIPLTRHTNSELSTLPVDATHASSAENLTALTWLLCPLNLAEPAPLATHG